MLKLSMATRPKRSARKKISKPLLIFAIFIAAATFAVGYRHLPDDWQNHTDRDQAVDSSLKLPSDFSLEDKIGQMLMVGVNSQAVAIDFEKNYQIGGFLLRPGSDLFDKAATTSVSKAGEVKPLFAVDEEGGQVARLPSVDFSLYSASYMGGLPDAQVEQIGHEMGEAMAAIGASVDLAPVVDIDDGQNSAIGLLERSFSSNPAVIADKAGAFAKGLRASGVLPTFKHFPGLGNATGPTGGNTDTASATSPDISSLKRSDLLPYRQLLNTSELCAVMVGNQIVPGLSNGKPASLSTNTYRLLRSEYGFNQVVFTDELLLAKAIAQTEPSPAAAVIDAIKAGADMPLIDTDDEQTLSDIINTVAAQVRSGQIKQSQLDASLQRIAQLKKSIAKE